MHFIRLIWIVQLHVMLRPPHIALSIFVVAWWPSKMIFLHIISIFVSVKKKSTFDSWKLELIFLRPTQEHDTANVECVGWCLRSLCWWSYEVNEQYFSNTKWLKWFGIFPLKHKTNLRSFMNLMKSIRFDLNQCIPIIQRSCLNNFGIKYLSLNEDVQLKSN